VATERTVLVRLKADISNYAAGMAKAAAVTKALGDNVDKTNDRTAWLAQSALALGPAFVPIGAAAVPALAGLAMQMGLAAGAAGVAALAFNGVGDGLKALNAYQLEPTAANLAKVAQEYEKLGPAGIAFVEQLDSLGAELSTVRDVARQEMFPGVLRGIDDVMSRMPQIRSVVGELASGMGQLTEEAGAGLAFGGMQRFFDYIERVGRPLLIDLGRTWGNLIEGMANMMVAFDPLTQQFSSGFLGMSRDFSEWSRNLDSNESFQEFLDYAQSAIPKVTDFIGSLVDAFVSLVKGLAPIGDVMLPVLARLLDVFGAFMETPLGTAFFALAAATSIYGRAAALASITTKGFLGTLLGIGPAATAGATGMGLLNTRMAAMRTGLRVGVAAMGMMAASMTDVDDKAGLTNTTMLGFMGLMAGPIGGAVGLYVGAMMDAASANDQMYESISDARSVLKSSPADFRGHTAAIEDARLKYDEFKDSVTGAFGSEGLGGAWNDLKGMFGESDGEKGARELRELETAAADLRATWSDLGNELSGGKTGDISSDFAELGRVARSAQPAMDALGITFSELQDARGTPAFSYMADQISDFIRRSDSVPGRMRGVAKAVADLENDMLTTADSASALATALEALLGPGLNAEEAFDAYKTSLRELRSELKDIQGPFRGYSKAAMENRTVTRDAAAATVEMLTTQAEAGASAKRLGNLLAGARRDFIREGVAAGISAKAMRARADAIGLTPKLIRTVLQAVTSQADRAIAKTQRSMEKYGATKETAVAMLRDVASGRIKTVQGLIDKYGISRKQATALLQDLASGKLGSIIRDLNAIDGRNANSTVTITTRRIVERGVRNIGNITQDLWDADGRIHEFYADGGMRPRIGSQMPQVRDSTKRGITWSEEGAGPWEAFISGHPAKADRSRAIASEVVARLGGEVRFADGGLLEQVYRGAMQTASPAAVSFPSELTLTGRVDTPWGPSDMVAVARSVATGAVDTYAEGRSQADRRNYSYAD
jgi:protein-disulfide isomerase-like protein with CxxC motif